MAEETEVVAAAHSGSALSQGLPEGTNTGLAQDAVGFVAAAGDALFSQAVADGIETALAVEHAAAFACGGSAFRHCQTLGHGDVAKEPRAALVIAVAPAFSLTTSQGVADFSGVTTTVVAAQTNPEIDIAA